MSPAIMKGMIAVLAAANRTAATMIFVGDMRTDLLALLFVYPGFNGFLKSLASADERATSSFMALPFQPFATACFAP